MTPRKCLNSSCEWHEKGTCRLFPGDFGFLTCKYSTEKSEAPKRVVKKGKSK
jgi:hypothetical protein